MDPVAVKLARALLSRAWSGASMLEGVNAVNSTMAQVKEEIPQTDGELREMIQDL